jgi:hypothetical protein
MIPPATFEPGQAFAWSSKDRCELIVAEWQRQGSQSKFRIYPARESPAYADAPDWAYVIESKS